MANDSYTKVHNLCINLTHDINKKTSQVYSANVEIADDGHTLIVKEKYNGKIGFDVYNRNCVIRYSFIQGWAYD